MKKGDKAYRMTAKKYAALQHAMDEDFTLESLVQDTGLSYDTIVEYVMAMRTHKPKLVYISAFEKDSLGRRNIRVFSRGNKPDLRIIPPTPAERYARTQDNKRIKAMNAFVMGGTA